ncbi:MAG TPA: ABC transporter permease [Aliidongia sp.]|uniref:ABC transporter permease n=1 Tax=Aliidongia sp. TaxID=1914230 RepID=UPI002DDCCE0C|nr:ABC transporter permease [Aliidongia sp.]HEV2676738.1 ABC transporter permease [Aliidongia sp.]
MRPAVICRIALLVGLVAMIEVLCLTGVIDHITMQPPHRIAIDLLAILASGKLNGAIAKTMGNAALAFGLALVIGVAGAIPLHRFRPVREMLDPLFATYYAIPIFAFYPLLIILFGLGDAPQIFIGAMLGIVAVIVNTLNGLDRVPGVLLKTARVNQMGPVETAWRVTLPYATPYILTGAKLAVAYSFIGIIGAEFIMSRGGMGYEISFAYTNFDNATMYPLIVLILLVSVAVNTLLARWEKRLMVRRGLQ